MLKKLFLIAFLSCPTIAQQPAAPPAEAPAIKRTDSGKGLVIPDEAKKLGTPYYTAPTPVAQVSFISDGKIRSEGHSVGVIGYAIAGPTDNPAALKAGCWAMPVKSLVTGNKLKDKHIADDTWLDAAKCPDAVFVLKEVRDVAPHKETAAGKSYTATLVGQMTLHGATRPVTIPDTILAFAAPKEGGGLKGDLLAIRCKYTIKFSDFGISNDYTTKLKTVNDEVQIDQSLVLSTVPPEEQPQPKKPDA